MVQVRDSYANPITGERFVFRATAATTGEYCGFDLRLGPQGKRAASHCHPGQLETFALGSGSLTAKIGGAGTAENTISAPTTNPGSKTSRGRHTLT